MLVAYLIKVILRREYIIVAAIKGLVEFINIIEDEFSQIINIFRNNIHEFRK